MDEIRHTDTRLESLIASLKDWLWETDADGRYTYSSPQVEALLGYSNEEILQLTLTELLPQGQKGNPSQNLSEILERQEPFENLKKYKRHKNGDLILLESNGSPFYDVAGNFTGYRGRDQAATNLDNITKATDFHFNLLDVVEEAVMISNPAGKIIYVNSAFTDLFGYSRDEIIGTDVNILYPKHGVGDTELQHLPPELDHKEHSSGVRKRLKKDGGIATLLVNARSLLDPEGKVYQFINSYHDITELENSQLKPRDSNRNEKLLELSQAIAHVGGWELDIATNSLYWTDETYRIHDTTPEEFDPSVDASVSFYLPESRKILQEALEAAMTEGKSYDLLLENHTAKGRKIHVRTTCEVLLKDGRPEKLTGVLQDITPFVAKEKSLIFALKENELALASANLGLWVLDAENNTLEWNDSQLEIYAMSREEFNKDPSPETYWNMVHEDDREALSNCLKSARRGETIENQKFRIIRKSGEARTIQGTAAPITNKAGKMTKLIGINRDITGIEENKNNIANLLEELSNSLRGTIQLAMNLAGMRDPYTSSHEHRVGIIAGEIGRIMRLSEGKIEGLIESGNLHDIGKFRVPLDILNKPGKLSSAEFEMVKQHAQDGYEVLKGISFPWPVAEVALQHHERIDGSGYPQGLKGDEIIPEARILAVADVVEAMASHRPYRPKLGIDKALEEIEQGRGVKYDPEVVDACLKLFKEEGFKIPDALT